MYVGHSTLDQASVPPIFTGIEWEFPGREAPLTEAWKAPERPSVPGRPAYLQVRVCLFHK